MNIAIYAPLSISVLTQLSITSFTDNIFNKILFERKHLVKVSVLQLKLNMESLFIHICVLATAFKSKVGIPVVFILTGIF